MLQVTTAQSLNRLHTLPEELVDAIFDETSADVIGEIGTSHHIPEDRVREIAKISGWTLLGFLHPESVAGELTDRIAIDPQVAKDVAAQLNNKLFASHRKLLDKVYAPPGETHAPVESGAGQAAQQKSEIKPRGKPLADIEKRAPSVRVATEEAPEQTEQGKPDRAPEQTEAGRGPQEVEVKAPEQTTNRPHELPEAPSKAKPTPPTPPHPPGHAPTRPDRSVGTGASEPFMLSKENKPQARAGRSDFKLKIDKELFKKDSDDGASAPPTPSARLEIGKQKEGERSRISRTTQEAPRVVHYSERRTPLAQPPTANPPKGDRPKEDSQQPKKSNVPGTPVPKPVPPTPQPAPEKPTEQTSPIPPKPSPEALKQAEQAPEPKEDSEQKDSSKTINLSDLG